LAHGFLLSGFLSPHSNKRADEYGGSLETRARFPLAVLRRVKEGVGKELAVTIKMNGSDFVEGGITLDEAKQTACIFERGGVDAITVSAATDSTLYMSIQPAVFPRGCLVPLAQGVKSVVSVPVVAVGRINDPQLAEAILADGKADLVAMGRSLICDPELPRKVAEGRPEDIRPCVACSTACTEGGQRAGVMSCISMTLKSCPFMAMIMPLRICVASIMRPPISHFYFNEDSFLRIFRARLELHHQFG
jgi:2,4-dienoyl-CoA reductase-like NADH-dependent reductase (Old Yellow Enzyme family)